MNARPVLNSFRHPTILRLGCVMLVALAWNGVAFCGEIHHAAYDGDLDKVKALLKDNPDLVFSKDELGLTPLHTAAAGGHKEMVELLLAKKADINARNKNGMTPLHYAAADDLRGVAELLLANKADVNAKDNDGRTPLDVASTDVAELLRQHGGHQ